MPFWRPYAFGIGLAVTGAAAAAFVSLPAASGAQPRTTTTTTTAIEMPSIPPITDVIVSPSARQPVAGKMFAGLTFHKVVDGGTISWVECDAKIGSKRLSARQRSFYAGPHQRNKVVCRWRIPTNAAGKEVHLWSYKVYGGRVDVVVHTCPHDVTAETLGVYWIVKR